ncbi:hypothetical protein ABPG74_007081 [Tetrahymena malaccensis]
MSKVQVHDEKNALNQAQQLSQPGQIKQDQAQTQIDTSKHTDPSQSPKPVQITCENCKQTGFTSVKKELIGKLQCCLAVLCILCIYGPCNYADIFIHYCSHCKTKIATHFKKQNNQNM